MSFDFLCFYSLVFFQFQMKTKQKNYSKTVFLLTQYCYLRMVPANLNPQLSLLKLRYKTPNCLMFCVGTLSLHIGAGTCLYSPVTTGLYVIFYLQAFHKVCVSVIDESLSYCLFSVVMTDHTDWIIYKEKIYSQSSEGFAAW